MSIRVDSHVVARHRATLTRVVARLAFLLILSASALRGEMFLVEAVEVPVDRVVRNIESLLAKQPDNVQLRINLARTHVMAFVVKSNRVAVPKGRETEGPVVGWLQQNVMPKEKPTADPAQLKTAREHLARAIAEYERVIAQAPDHPLARLGYAWALQASGSIPKAIEAYRATVRVAWPKEGAATSGVAGFQTVTQEAAKYLIPLLDPVADRDEIATLKERSAKIASNQRSITPIAIPLRDGLTALDIVDGSARVRFDLDGSGIPKPWTWITPDAGWLVMDLHGRRQPRSGLQLFGNVTFWLFCDNGYDAMRMLDDDGDGRLRGAELDGLAIWRDENSDGVSDPGEVRPISEWQIVELSCADERDARHPDEIAMSPAGVRFANGRIRPSFDVVLHPARSVTDVVSEQRGRGF